MSTASCQKFGPEVVKGSDESGYERDQGEEGYKLLRWVSVRWAVNPEECFRQLVDLNKNFV